MLAMAFSFMRFLDHTQLYTPQSVVLLWTSNQPVAGTSTCTTHNTHNRQTSMPTGGIRTHILSRRAAADPRLRPRGHWDRLLHFLHLSNWLTVTFYSSLLGPKVNILNTLSPMVANYYCFPCRNSYEPLHASYWFVLTLWPWNWTFK